MPFEKIAEEKIREAMAQGEFDNLSGSGEPLRGLDSYFATPEGIRLGYSVLKSAGVIPEEIDLLRHIESLKRELKNCTHRERRRQLQTQIEEYRLKYELIMERYNRSRAR